MTTPILRPGDHIHLAVPISASLSGQPLKEEIAKLQQTFNEGYGRFGVTIATMTVASSIATPVVVAVFRSAEGGGQ